VVCTRRLNVLSGRYPLGRGRLKQVLDRFVPHTHGEWLASHVPTAHPHLSEDHGHLSLAWASIGEILDDLLERI
jgi:hypothetical protein